MRFEIVRLIRELTVIQEKNARFYTALCIAVTVGVLEKNFAAPIALGCLCIITFMMAKENRPIAKLQYEAAAFSRTGLQKTHCSVISKAIRFWYFTVSYTALATVAVYGGPY